MVELVVAMTILVSVAGIMGLSLVTSNKLTRQSRETRIASLELSRVMEDVIARQQADIQDDFEVDVPIPQQSALSGLSITPTYPGFVADSDLLPIVLVANWTAFDGSQRSLQLICAKGP